ncbi:MAG: efflux RND transporter periplasmic adaptor subunit [Pseudomonadales bacterium]|nr:efflux RND transporter periplasmic adaptor subunit [Pseudomonadales bacterium]
MLGRCGAVNRVVLATVVLMALLSCKAESESSSVGSAPHQAPVVNVEVMHLREESVTITSELPARIMPYRLSEVRPQVDGIVTGVLLKDGFEVTAGQPLFQIDPRRYQAAVNSAEAALKKAEANLAAVRVTDKRYRNLQGTQAVSQQQHDDVKALLKQREAEVAVAQTALEEARVDLGFTVITAPIDGHIEQFMATEGALVEELQLQPLATIRQMDPVFVDMTQAGSELVAIRKQLMSGVIKPVASPKITLFFADGSRYEHQGDLLYSELNVNANTGSALVRGVIANPQRLLMSGQFLKAIVEQGIRDHVVLVPQRAVSFDRQGAAVVMLVDDNNKVTKRIIHIGRAMGNYWLTEAGVAAGDRVIVEGLQNVRPGSVVNAIETTIERLAQE